MSGGVKDMMAKLLAEWLFKDFGILLDEPTSEDIEESLEELPLEKFDEKR